MDKPRLWYLTNFKIFLTALVVFHHSISAYTVGEHWLVMDSAQAVWFGNILAVNASFFMAAFFMISGYFVPPSHGRYGAWAFINGKCRRLLIPTLVTTTTLLPLAYFLGQTDIVNFADFLRDYFTFEKFNLGHMWFVVQLFLYCVVYLAIAQKFSFDQRQGRSLAHSDMLGLIIVMGLATYVLSLWFPINQWYGMHMMEPFHAAQYIIMFLFGLWCYRCGLFEHTGQTFTWVWLVITMLTIGAKLIFYFHGYVLRDWQFVVWSTLMCVSMSISLTLAFRYFFNFTNKFLMFLGDQTYAVYIIHVPILVALNRAVLQEPWPAEGKALLVFTLTYAASNLCACGLRKLPGVKRFV